MAKILLVEDDKSLSETLAYNLRAENYTPVIARDAPSAIGLARKEKPDLILLDLMLPGGSGLEICKAVRGFSAVPIIILTARDEDVDRILGLEIGADDYVTKPFSLRELLARIKSNLRRVDLDRRGQISDIIHHGNISVDVTGRHAAVGADRIVLQPKEFDLLTFLLRHPDKVFTREQLLRSVWGHDFVGERTVDVHVRRVRAKLESAGAKNIIRTVHGVGYSCDPDAPPAT
ncbi:MAG: response regulator transcription factor [Chloroflexota bacterium]